MNNSEKEKKKDRRLQIMLWIGSAIVTIVSAFIAGGFYVHNTILKNDLEKLKNNCANEITILSDDLERIKEKFYNQISRLQREIKEKDSLHNSLAERFAELSVNYKKNAEKLKEISKQMNKLKKERDSLKVERDSLFFELTGKKDSLLVARERIEELENQEYVFDSIDFIRADVGIIPIEKVKPKFIFNPNKYTPKAKNVEYLEVIFSITDLFGEGKYIGEEEITIYVTYEDYRDAHMKNPNNTAIINGKEIDYFEAFPITYKGKRITGMVEIRLDEDFIAYKNHKVVFYTDKGEIGKHSIELK